MSTERWSWDGRPSERSRRQWEVQCSCDTVGSMQAGDRRRSAQRPVWSRWLGLVWSGHSRWGDNDDADSVSCEEEGFEGNSPMGLRSPSVRGVHLRKPEAWMGASACKEAHAGNVNAPSSVMPPGASCKGSATRTAGTSVEQGRTGSLGGRRPAFARQHPCAESVSEQGAGTCGRSSVRNWSVDRNCTTLKLGDPREN